MLGLAENYAKWSPSVGLNTQVDILSIVYREIKGCLGFWLFVGENHKKDEGVL